MPVLVTGGAAYIGSHVVPELIDAGEEVIALDNLSTGFACAMQSGMSHHTRRCGQRGTRSHPKKYALPFRHRFAAEGNMVPIGSGKSLTAH
jgi:hypothetical protein